MQEKGIISTNQFVWMLFIVITSVAATQAPRMLITIAGRDAWLSVIGGWFMDVLLALVYAYMGIRFPGQNFVQYSIMILGKYVGRIVGILFPLFFLLVCTLILSALVQMVNTVFLPRTPHQTILIICFILVAYAARKGIEVIARVAELLGPLFIFGIVAIGLLSIPVLKIDRFKPQFEQGVYPFLIGSPFILTFFAICIMMAMFIPLCNRPENGFIAKFAAVSMGALFIGIIVTITIAFFGFEHAQRMYELVYQITRTVNFRFEAFWMLIVISAGIIASANLIWAFSLGLSQIVGLNTYKPLVYPAALISLMLGLASFDNNIELMNFVHYTFPLLATFVEGGLEIFLFVSALILNKRGGNLS